MCNVYLTPLFWSLFSIISMDKVSLRSSRWWSHRRVLQLCIRKAYQLTTATICNVTSTRHSTYTRKRKSIQDAHTLSIHMKSKTCTPKWALVPWRTEMQLLKTSSLKTPPKLWRALTPTSPPRRYAWPRRRQSAMRITACQRWSTHPRTKTTRGCPRSRTPLTASAP